MKQRIWKQRSWSFAVAALWAAPVCAQDGGQTPEGGLNDFLVDNSGSYIGAAGIIGLDGQVVRDTASPKEFVASVNALRRSDAKDGVGVAFSPGRSRLERLMVDLSAMDQDKSAQGLLKNPWRRLWGATTFSYAQKRADLGVLGEHRFWAYAVNTEYYWNFKDDPAVAAYSALRDAGTCQMARKQLGLDTSKLAASLKQVRLWVTESALAAARAEQVAAAAAAEAKLAATKSDDGATAKAKAAELAAEAKSSAAKSDLTAVRSLEQTLNDCVTQVNAAAVSQWNAPKLTLLWGRGQLQGTGAGAPRYSLGTHLQVAASLSPGYPFDDQSTVSKQSQLTASYKRMTGAVDTATLASSAAYKNLSLFALRYTYAFGEGGNPGSTGKGITSYLLAELSNAKSSQGALAAGTYKQALGWDYKLGANMWLELRTGRSVARTGAKDETKSMLTLKLSPEAGLAALMPAK